MGKPIITVEKLSKTFISKERKKGQKRKKEVHGLKDVSLDIFDGEIFGLLGYRAIERQARRAGTLGEY